MTRTDPDSAHDDPEVRAPTVLAVLVVRNGARWLRDCLHGLSTQTYPRFGVVAVDNASTDESVALLEQALGAGRVRRLAIDEGVAGAADAALDVPVAMEADYLLVIHDDTALEPDTVARLVEAAEGIQGTGIVGPKVVDWDDPRILREVGRSTDRFGHSYTPLQDGEVDHGQYDRVLEVLFVSSCAMLVQRDVWRRVGALDERLASQHEDMDFCWRARLAGFRVVMTPLARVRHDGATAKGRRGPASRRGERYFGERASLVAMLKNYRLGSLLWLLPLYFGLGLGRLALMALTRRFDDALDLLAAWAWNLRRLPGTIRRRARAQRARVAKDRDIRRFMESAALRLPRWLDEASRMLVERRAPDDEELPGLQLRAQTRSLIRAHPVLLGGAIAIVVGSFAAGPVLGADPLTGGVLARFPGSAAAFFHELVSGTRTTVLGGTQAGSPALGIMGALAWALFDNPSLAQRLLLVALPAIGGAMTYRAVGRQTGERVSATVAAGGYALSAVMLGAFSEGRIALLATLAVLPVVVERMGAGFGATWGRSTFRLSAGIGVSLAVGVAFFPATVLPSAVALLVLLVTARARLRGLRIAVVGWVVAAALVFPMLPDLVGHPAPSLASLFGRADFASISRTALGPGLGSWVVAWFLPAGALLSLVVVSREHRAAANRTAVLSVVAIFLTWGSAAGHLPEAISNPMAYAALAAVAEAFLIGFGVAGVVSGLGGEAFGLRQIAAGALTFVLALGLSLQAFAAVTDEKAVGEQALPDAWPVVASADSAEFRVLWLGRLSGDPFPPPGGDARGIVEAGPASVRYALTGRDGITALDAGRGEFGAGYEALEVALGELVSGSTRHTGALLSTHGIRYVVAASEDLPDPVAEKLEAQVDMDRIIAVGLAIYRIATPFPTASIVDANDALIAAARGRYDPDRIAALERPQTHVLVRAPGGWTGDATGVGRPFAFVADEFGPDWILRGGGATSTPEPAFGWATAVRVPAGTGALSVTLEDQWVRTLQVIVLGALWLAALWITRRPVSR